MYTRSNDQEAMDAYFHGVYDRLLPIKRIWDEYSKRVPRQMKSGEGRTVRAFLATGYRLAIVSFGAYISRF